MGQFVCDGTCAGNELGDCNHGDSNDGLGRLGAANDKEHRRQYPHGCGSRGRCLICHPIKLEASRTCAR
jgi:hypothetical protein